MPTEVRVPVPDIAASSNWLVQVTRGMVRPALALGFAGMFIYTGIDGSFSELPQELVVIGTGIIAWWFGGRAAEKANGG